MSAWYGAIWPQPVRPSSVVTRTRPTNRLLKLSIDEIRSGLKSGHDHRAQTAAEPRIRDGFVDLLERKLCGDQLVQLEPARGVHLDHRGQVGVWSSRPHLAAEHHPAAVCDFAGV